MARLHHVTRAAIAAAGRGPQPIGVPTWRPARPRTETGVEPWFVLTPDAPSADTRVAAGPGVVATLETFGGVTGPALVGSDDASDRAMVVLGGAVVPAGSSPPDDRAAFTRQCTAIASVHAAELGRGRQCLLVFGVRAEGPTRVATVQSFVGIVPIAEDLVSGDDRLAFAIDADDTGDLAVAIAIRLCGSDAAVRLGIRGVVGYLL